jgi:hypothetical protein
MLLNKMKFKINDEIGFRIFDLSLVEIWLHLKKHLRVFTSTKLITYSMLLNY